MAAEPLKRFVVFFWFPDLRFRHISYHRTVGAINENNLFTERINCMRHGGESHTRCSYYNIIKIK